MQQSVLKNITAFLFLVAFLAPRVANLHALDHLSEGEDTISCELCDITLQSQQLDLHTGDALYEDIQITKSPSAYIANSFYNSPTASIVSPLTVYNKPPPTF
jgi:hypothetical protein